MPSPRGRKASQKQFHEESQQIVAVVGCTDTDIHSSLVAVLNRHIRGHHRRRQWSSLTQRRGMSPPAKYIHRPFRVLIKGHPPKLHDRERDSGASAPEFFLYIKDLSPYNHDGDKSFFYGYFQNYFIGYKEGIEYSEAPSFHPPGKITRGISSGNLDSSTSVLSPSTLTSSGFAFSMIRKSETPLYSTP